MNAANLPGTDDQITVARRARRLLTFPASVRGGADPSHERRVASTAPTLKADLAGRRETDLDRADAERLGHAILTLGIRLRFEFAARLSAVLLLEREGVGPANRRVVRPDSKTGS